MSPHSLLRPHRVLLLLTMLGNCLRPVIPRWPPIAYWISPARGLRAGSRRCGRRQGLVRTLLEQSLQLPGSLQAQGFGPKPPLDTKWTGSIRPEVFQMPRYAPYRDGGQFQDAVLAAARNTTISVRPGTSAP